MDFPDDPKVADIGDEYMFGPAFLVAPVTTQGATSRSVYLPAGTDWYDFWTNERVAGGRTIEVSAPIDTLPLFVRAGSIVPVGTAIENTSQIQQLEKIRVYSGADADLSVYQDDGNTYAYEGGARQVTGLHWDNGSRKFSHSGPVIWSGPESGVVEVIGE